MTREQSVQYDNGNVTTTNSKLTGKKKGTLYKEKKYADKNCAFHSFGGLFGYGRSYQKT
jgi:hypothetical protein